MSLARMALRVIAVQAVLNRTVAASNVNDSKIGTIDENVDESELPFVAVYTDDSKGEGINCTGSVDLSFEIGITAKMIEKIDGKDTLFEDIPPTDAGFEIAIDMIERQIKTALVDPANIWAGLFLRLMQKVISTNSLRGASDRDGMRFAGRRLVITGDVLADPTFGQTLPAKGFWKAFLDALEASPDAGLVDMADLFKALIGVGTPDAEIWLHQQRAMELSIEHARALMITPDDENAPANTVITAIAGQAEPEEI